MNEIVNSLEGSSLLISILGGILIGLPTGPARFLVVDTCFDRGRLAALIMYSGLFAAIFLYACIALFTGEFISGNETVETGFRIGASALIVGWGILIIFRSKGKEQSSVFSVSDSLFRTGLISGLSNPVIPFIYLAFIQFIEGYSQRLSVGQNVGYILIFELFSFLTTLGIAFTLRARKRNVEGSWRIIKILMGGLLVCTGVYNLLSLL